MRVQKSAEAIVGVAPSRRAEHEVPRVGVGLSSKPMKAEADRADHVGAEDPDGIGGGCDSRRGGQGDPDADESGAGGTSLMER